MKKLFIVLIFTLWGFNLQAITDLNRGDLATPSLISPYYFGPNAFPIPDDLEGTTLNKMRLEIGADYFAGYQGDKTTDIYFKLTLPLFSERVNMSIWMPAKEWWTTTPERALTCRLNPERALKGNLSGDVYISTDIWLLQAEKYGVDLAIRAAMKTASGGDFEFARYYDSPAYFFDASLSKAFGLGGEIFKELRFSFSTGFLCWQTNNGRQNDAVMYGFTANLRTKHFTFRESLAGYAGWESNINKGLKAGDRPFSLKSDIIYYYKNFEFLARFQHGLNDYPFNQFRIGLGYQF